MSVQSNSYSASTGRSSPGTPDLYSQHSKLTLSQGAAGSETSVVITSTGELVLTVDPAKFERLCNNLQPAEVKDGKVEITIEILNKLLALDAENPAGALFDGAISDLFVDAVESFKGTYPGLYRETLDAHIQANRPLPMSIFDVLSLLMDKTVEALNASKLTDAMVVAENTKTIVETQLDEQAAQNENTSAIRSAGNLALGTGLTGGLVTAGMGAGSAGMAVKSSANSLKAAQASDDVAGVKMKMQEKAPDVEAQQSLEEAQRDFAKVSADRDRQHGMSTALGTGGQGLGATFQAGGTEAQTQTQVSNSETQAKTAELQAVRASAEALKSTATEGVKSAEETSGQVIQSLVRAKDSAASTQGNLMNSRTA